MTDPLEPLRRRFHARMRDDLAVVEVYLGGESLNFDDLRLLAHRLAGAAGTFGYEDISQIAGELEDQLLQHADTRPVLVRLRDALVDAQETGP